jgi:hypothetical protein
MRQRQTQTPIQNSNIAVLQQQENSEWEFLNEEFEGLWEQKRDSTELSEKRLNMYLLVVFGGLFSIFTFIISVKKDLPDDFKEYKFLIPSILSLYVISIISFGFFTFERSIVRLCEIGLYEYRMNRIRLHYVQKNPKNKNAIMIIKNEINNLDLTKHGLVQNNNNFYLTIPYIIAMLNSSLIAIFISTAYRFSMNHPNKFVLIIASFSYVVVFILHYLRYKHRVEALRRLASTWVSEMNTG